MVGLDWKASMKEITRMKPAPAFDATDLKSPENEEFGSMDMGSQAFSEFSMEYTETEAGRWLPSSLFVCSIRQSTLERRIRQNTGGSVTGHSTGIHLLQFRLF